VPARPRRLTGGPRLSAAVIPRARPPSLACCPVGPIYRHQFPSPVLSLSLSLSLSLASPVRQPLSRCPARPLFSLCAVGLPCQFRPSALAMDRRVRTHARRRISRPRCPTTTPGSLFRSPPVPRAHPSPHFARLHPFSHSAHAASHRRRPVPVFSAI
jgi:hypothetical protein